MYHVWRAKEYSHFLALQSMARMLGKVENIARKKHPIWKRCARTVWRCVWNQCTVQNHHPRRFDGWSDTQSCGISTVYPRPSSKRQRYLIAAKHVSQGEYNTDISRNAQYLALFRSPSDRKQIGIIAEHMFEKNKVHFMNAYYKETEKPYRYSLVDNKPGTPPDNQILANLFGECYAYYFGVNSTEPTRVETKPVGKHSTTTKTTSSRK